MAERRTSFPPPVGVLITEPPYRTLNVNVFWYPHLLGVLTRLASPSAWEGDIEDKLGAEQEVLALLVAATLDEQEFNYGRYNGAVYA